MNLVVLLWRYYQTHFCYSRNCLHQKYPKFHCLYSYVYIKNEVCTFVCMFVQVFFIKILSLSSSKRKIYGETCVWGFKRHNILTLDISICYHLTVTSAYSCCKAKWYMFVFSPVIWIPIYFGSAIVMKFDPFDTEIHFRITCYI